MCVVCVCGVTCVMLCAYVCGVCVHLLVQIINAPNMHFLRLYERD